MARWGLIVWVTRTCRVYQMKRGCLAGQLEILALAALQASRTIAIAGAGAPLGLDILFIVPQIYMKIIHATPGAHC